MGIPISKVPPVLLALLAPAPALVATGVVAWILPHPLPLAAWATIEGLLAALVAWRLGLGRIWQAFQVILPWALVWHLTHQISPWIYPAILGSLILVFGGGILSRVPLYHSNRAAWHALLELIPAGDGIRMVDLGAGMAGPLAFLARQRPDVQFTGVEASPLVWLAAWIRTLPVRRNCRIQLGSLWNLPLDDVQVVYAFLSPAPMPDVWTKASRELPADSLLISNTFEIPGIEPWRIIPLSGRKDARLWVYRR